MWRKMQRGLWTALIDAKIVTKKETWLEQSLYRGSLTARDRAEIYRMVRFIKIMGINSIF